MKITSLKQAKANKGRPRCWNCARETDLSNEIEVVINGKYRYVCCYECYATVTCGLSA